jgi:hypothetical protein
VKSDLRAAFWAGTESSMEGDAKSSMRLDGIRAASSGVALRLLRIVRRGEKPHRALNGVRAIASSGLWFASGDGGSVG